MRDPARRPCRPAPASVAALAAAALLALPSAGRAWIYPEHRDIAVAGVEKPEPAEQAAIQALWAEARQGYLAKLCEKISEGDVHMPRFREEPGPFVGVFGPIAGGAAWGGLLGYEQSFMTGAGSFQIVLGREVQATLFGFMGQNNVPLIALPVTVADGSSQPGAPGLKSVALTFPVPERTPFGSFATRLAFAVQLQLGFGVELPTSVQVLYPAGAIAPTAPPTWTVLLRGAFDGRYFLCSTETVGAAVLQP